MQMIKSPVSELSDNALAWAVAKAANVELSHMPLDRQIQMYGALQLKKGGAFKPADPADGTLLLSVLACQHTIAFSQDGKCVVKFAGMRPEYAARQCKGMTHAEAAARYFVLRENGWNPIIEIPACLLEPVNPLAVDRDRR